MPELPDILVYLDALEPRVVGRPIKRVRIVSPFLLRTFDPPIEQVEGKTVQSLSRLGKRIVFHLDDGLHMVLHLMIAGRLRWQKRPPGYPGRIGLAAMDFPDGTLHVTEAGTQKRASLHLVRGHDALAALDPGGLEVLDADLTAFREALGRENHTLKRALTDPHVLSGIGNAYSDEILHAAGLSPFKQTHQLSDDETTRLHRAAVDTLQRWITTLRDQFADRFPGAGDITAFRDDFAVHGRFGKPCPTCGTAVQRIRYASNEINYCPRCQTEGRLLADRSLSRLLKKDWPKTIDELEQP